MSVDLQEEIEFLTKIIEERSIDIAPDYHSWRDLGFALADALGENGRDYFHRISRFYLNYSYDEAEKQFTACLNHHGHGITSKTIFHLAKQAGITIGSRSLSPFPNPVPSIIPQSTISAELMQTFSDKVKDHLPDFLKNIADNAISDEDADLLILGTLTVVSACLPNISGIYAGREVFPNLFLFVTAQASSGKGRLTLCRYIVEYIHKQLREEYENELEIYRRQFFDLYCALKVSYPIRFALSASQQTEFHTFFEQIQNEYSSVFGFDFVASVRRLGLIAFRLTMIMSALRILENGEIPNVMLCSDDDFSTVKTIVKTLLMHTAKVYQMLPENISNSIGNKNQLKQQYYDSLPPDFDKQTAISIAQSLEIPQKTAERYLKQWCLSGQMNRVKHGRYKK